MKNYRYSNFEEPKVKDGHLYYIRLKTKFGPIYKLGFTSWSSVEDRFAYKGKGDEKLIDKVLMFVYLNGAYHVEQKIHDHFQLKSLFGAYSNAHDMPLAGNGQSELYAEDILNLDSTYTPAQAEATRFNIRVGIAYRSSATEDIARLKVKTEDAFMGVADKIGKFFRLILNPKRFLRDEYFSEGKGKTDDGLFTSTFLTGKEYYDMKNLPIKKILQSMHEWSDGGYPKVLQWREERRREAAKLIDPEP